MAHVYRIVKRGCVIITFFCFVALFRHLIGALQTSYLQQSCVGNETYFLDKICSSTIFMSGIQQVDKSKQIKENGTEPSNWLERTQWESKIDHHTYQYLINPKEKCDSIDLVGSSGNLTLLVLVKSAPGNLKLRDVIRRTYIQGVLKYNVSCRAVFLLGFPGHDESKQAEIIKEAEIHGDIIQEDFTDSYYNLTTKVIMGVKWAMTFCKNSQFVMLTDDDVMFDIMTLVDDLSKAPPKYHSEFVLGELTYDASPFRDPKGKFKKFYTPKRLYPLDKYPTYPQGYGYIISKDVVPRVFHASQELPPPVPWEDVYFGALLNKIKVRVTDRKPWYRERHKDKTAKANPLTPHDDYFKIELSIDNMKAVWNAIESELIENLF